MKAIWSEEELAEHLRGIPAPGCDCMACSTSVVTELDKEEAIKLLRRVDQWHREINDEPGSESPYEMDWKLVEDIAAFLGLPRVEP